MTIAAEPPTVAPTMVAVWSEAEDDLYARGKNIKIAEIMGKIRSRTHFPAPGVFPGR